MKINQAQSSLVSQDNFEERIETVVDNIEQPISSPILEKETERLDEIISTYEANTQN